LRQAQNILSRIQLGEKIRTDPRSTVGRLVNQALQRQIDIQESLREQERIELEKQGEVIVDGKGFSVAPELQEEFIQQKIRAGATQIKVGETTLTAQQIRERQAQIQAEISPEIIEREQPEFIRDAMRVTGVRPPTEVRTPILPQKIRRIADVVTLGAFTQTDIRRESKALQQDIESFNIRFGDRELTQEEFDIAQKETAKIEERQRRLAGVTEVEEAKGRTKVKGFVFGTTLLTKDFDFERAIIKNEKELRNIESKLLDPNISTLNRMRLEKLQKSLLTENISLKQGQVPVILTGDVPLTPVIGAIGRLPKNTKVKFIGSQRQVSKNQFITDIVFEVDGREVGLARGVTITKGKDAVTITIGKSGVVGVKLPSQKGVLGKSKVFAGSEVGTIRPVVEAEKAIVATTKPSSLFFVKGKDIKSLAGIGTGKVATVRGTKFIEQGLQFPTGKLIRKLPRGIQRERFLTISRIFTKKDLNLIIGGTLSPSQRAKFIGLVTTKGVDAKSVATLSKFQKLQYKKALEQVIGTASASLRKGQQLTGVRRLTSLLATGGVSADVIAHEKKVAKLKQEVTVRQVKEPVTKQFQIIKSSVQIQKEKQTIAQKQKTKAKTEQAKKNVQKLKKEIKSRMEQVSTVRAKSKQLSKSVSSIKQQLRQKQTQTQKQLLRQKVLQQQKAKAKTIKQLKLLITKVGETKLKKALAKAKSKNQSFDIVTGVTKKTRKLVAKRLPPNRALRFAQRHVDKNIAASFKLKLNRKPPIKKDIAKPKLSRKFTVSKTDPTFLKEISKYRLDSPSERRQLKLAKRIAKQKKKKRGKKKR
jgi:hypothetical protein